VLRLATGVAGIARDLVIAAVFRRDETDTFFVAFTLPSALRVLLTDGMTSRGIAPVVSRKLRKEGEDAAKALYSRLRAVGGAVFLLAAVAGMALSQPITELLATGYRHRYGEFERTTWLSVTLFPYLLMTGLAALGAVALHVKKRGASPWTGLVFSMSVLAATLTLPHLLDARGWDRAQALAVGILVGGFVPLVIDWRARRAIGWAEPAVIDLKLPEIRDVARRAAPVAVALAPFYLELLVSRRLLSEMRPGAQSAFWWAMRICETLQVLVVSAVALAPPPQGDATAEDNARTVSRRLRLALFASVPAALLVSVLSRPIVTAALERGAFDASASYETARALVWQGGALWMATALGEVVSGFYVADDARTPARLGLLGAVVFLAVAFGLRERMGHPAVSAALAAATATQLALAVPLLGRKLPLEARPILGSAARTLAASLTALIVAAALLYVLPEAATGDAFSRFLPGALGVLSFVMTFALAARGLRSPELELVMHALRSRWRRRRRRRRG
jgi:putative peptidoglycan lipid II flippase